MEKGVKKEEKKKKEKKKVFFWVFFGCLFFGFCFVFVFAFVFVFVFFRMCLNLNDHQINMDCYLHRTLYMNIMVTTNPKPMIDTQNIKRKKTEQNTIATHQSQRRE